MAAILGPKWSAKKLESKVAFGSAVERKMFPVHAAPTRLGIEQGIRGHPHRGPGCYDNDPISLFLQPINARPRSTRGFGFGAVRSNRASAWVPNADIPGPGEYQNVGSSTETKAYKPFSSAEERFKDPPHTLDHLGPGSHEHEVSRNRKVEFEESFGGPKQLKKTITTKCTLGIPDKCCQCGEVPVGDYYENRRKQALCRPCHNQLSKSAEEGVATATAILRGVMKVRDCSSIHKHDFPGKAPKTMLKTEKEQKKLQYREAYLSLYYS